VKRDKGQALLLKNEGYRAWIAVILVATTRIANPFAGQEERLPERAFFRVNKASR
jgi:hypothetical protein